VVGGGRNFSSHPYPHPLTHTDTHSSITVMALFPHHRHHHHYHHHEALTYLVTIYACMHLSSHPSNSFPFLIIPIRILLILLLHLHLLPHHHADRMFLIHPNIRITQQTQRQLLLAGLRHDKLQP